MLDVEVNGFGGLMEGIAQANNDVKLGTVEGGRATAEKLLIEIQTTAPVDSGEYKNDWRIDENRGDEDTIYIVNSTTHGPYLVFPNSRMKGSPKADDPGRGIIHNVRGIVHSHQKDAQQTFIAKLQDMIFG